MILETLIALAAQASGTAPSALRPPWDGPPPGEVISSPNWSDYRNYPNEARRHDQEGLVAFALRIDPTGKAIECSITESSGFPSLDASTCQLATQMRFAPARDDSGKAVESVYRTRVFWLLDDPRPFASSSLDADLIYDGEKLVGCEVRGTGPYFQPWKAVVCRHAQIYPEKLKGRRDAPAKLTLSVRVDAGDGLLAEPDWPQEAVIARDYTSFTINSKGDASDCTAEADGDIFSNDFRSQDACGYFLSTIWFEKPAKREPRPRGQYELRLTASNRK